LFGWQRPCYLLSEGGYVQSFRELMETTDWDAFGRASGNPKCADCMVHCGYEPSAVAATFGSLRGLIATARRTMFGLPAMEAEPSPSAPVSPAPHFSNPPARRREFVQISS
jgi:hypothetical protein